MADRFLFKKFASETNDVGQFGSFQSTGGNIGDGVKTTDPDLIQSLPAWKAGWGNAVDNGLLLPRLEEMNGVQRVFAEMLWNQWRDGITFWQAGAPVKALQSVVMYQTGDDFPKFYINKTGVNGTNPPPQDTDNWKPLSDFFVTTDTAQTISGVKTFTANTIVNGGAGNGTFTIKNDVTDYGTSAVDLVVATTNGKNQFLVHFQEGNKWCAYFDQDPSTKNITFLLTPCEKVLVPTPALTANDAQPATTAWFNSKMQVVSALPANPNPNVFYFIPG